MGTYKRCNVQGEVVFQIKIRDIPGYLAKHPEDPDKSLMMMIYRTELRRYCSPKGQMILSTDEFLC